ncbi:bifunctional xylanase/deacetylase [Ophiocordyceps sinensis CO18]|uniref:Bifunctional xylanase/deacetylase n=1 Tax=Ophiocordyceps sinensis (strain Co18 / CGMCC 3.14243) TaxID=911162 RepID=T5AHU3_OPHSC|nr:bifunctional xylanase/deacetylase [Ophiocordyceps sinensis CO18]
MALTFDDGPGEYTSRLLDILDGLGVHATFFITGGGNNKGHIDDESTGYPEVLRRMHAAGHQLASHTWSHQSLDALSAGGGGMHAAGHQLASHTWSHQSLDALSAVASGWAGRKAEVTFNEMAFRNVFGFFPTYFRAPYLECGSACRTFLGEYGYHIISTNSDTKDYENDDPALIANSRARFSDSVARQAGAQGYIVLAHDVHLQSVVNLAEYMVREARSRGYELVTVGECLDDARENWYREA